MHSLSPYCLRVFDKDLAGPFSERYRFVEDIRGNDLLDLIEAFLTSHGDEYVEAGEGKLKKKIRFLAPSRAGRAISGWIESGDYGVKGKIVDLNSGKTKYEKTKTDSDVSQLYYRFVVPEGKKTAVGLFHAIHGRGVKSIFDGMFNQFLKSRCGLVCQINPLTYEKALADWVDAASVKKLRVIGFTGGVENRDVVDSLHESAVDITFTPKGKKASYGGLKGLLKREKGTDAEAIVAAYEHCSANIKAEVIMNGKKRVFTVTGSGTPVGSIDFDESDVEMDDGVPKFSSLDVFAEKIAKEMADKL